MGLSPQDALAALNDVEAADTRARASQANRAGAPYLILWGVVWVIGYGLSGVLPPRDIGWMWMGVSLAGFAGMFLLPRRQSSGSRAFRRGSAEFFFENVRTDIDTLVADVNPRTGDQFLNFGVTLSAERTHRQI